MQRRRSGSVVQFFTLEVIHNVTRQQMRPPLCGSGFNKSRNKPTK